MIVSRAQVLVLLLIWVCLSVSHPTVVRARYLKERVKDMRERREWRKNTDVNGDDDFVAYTNREVPSCPDPLHNR